MHTGADLYALSVLLYINIQQFSNGTTADVKCRDIDASVNITASFLSINKVSSLGTLITLSSMQSILKAVY